MSDDLDGKMVLLLIREVQRVALAEHATVAQVAGVGATLFYTACRQMIKGDDIPGMQASMRKFGTQFLALSRATSLEEFDRVSTGVGIPPASKLPKEH